MYSSRAGRRWLGDINRPAAHGCRRNAWYTEIALTLMVAYTRAEPTAIIVRAVTSHTTRLGIVLGALAGVAISTSIAGASTRQARSAAAVVSPATARRIAVVWGGSA